MPLNEEPNPFSAIAGLAGIETPKSLKLEDTASNVKTKILLVNDDADENFRIRKALETNNCLVVPAQSVTQALKQMAAQRFDVLITDLHLPNPGDGFTVVTAMRHLQPDVLNCGVNDHRDTRKALAASVLQADEIMQRPVDVAQLIPLITKGKLTFKRSPTPGKEAVATILDRDVAITNTKVDNG